VARHVCPARPPSKLGAGLWVVSEAAPRGMGRLNLVAQDGGVRRRGIVCLCEICSPLPDICRPPADAKCRCHEPHLFEPTSSPRLSRSICSIFTLPCTAAFASNAGGMSRNDGHIVSTEASGSSHGSTGQESLANGASDVADWVG